MPNTQNIVCWFVLYGVYLLQSFLGGCRQERNRAWNESTTLDRQRKINRYRMREIDRDLEIIFLVFCYSSRTFLLGISSSHLYSRCGTDSRSGWRNFRPVFTSPRLVSNCLSFSVFYPTFTLTAFALNFLQPITTRWPFALDTFLFLTWTPAAIVNWFLATYYSLSFSFLPYHRAPLSLSLSLCLESISYICPSFFTISRLTSKSS